jgi:hypothetical protein
MKIWKLAPTIKKNDNTTNGQKIITVLPLKAIVNTGLAQKNGCRIIQYKRVQFRWSGNFDK